MKDYDPFWWEDREVIEELLREMKPKTMSAVPILITAALGRGLEMTQKQAIAEVEEYLEDNS